MSADGGVAARHSSESNEHYTPVAIIEAARATMGGIDVDPASCALANESVCAEKFYDIAANGFTKSWSGGRDGEGSTRWPSRVFLNPPGGWQDGQGRRVIKATKTTPPCNASGACGLPPGHEHDSISSAAKAWWFKLQDEIRRGCVEQAVFVGFSVEIIQTTQVDPPASLPSVGQCAMCFPSRRIAYLTEKAGALKVGASPPHSTVIVYCGPHPLIFRAAFEALGVVVVPR